MVASADEWKFSNYLECINQRDTDLMDKELRDAYFANAREYQQFIEEYQIELQNKELSKFLFEE